MKIKNISVAILMIVFFHLNAVSSDLGHAAENKIYNIEYPYQRIGESSRNYMDSVSGERKSNKVETLSGNNGHTGGYGALTIKGSKFKDAAIMMMGIRGAWVINRSFGLGIDLNGIIPATKYDDVDPSGRYKGILLGGYGGLLLEPIIWSNKIVHLAIPMSMGAGWLGYVEDWEDEMYYYSGDLLDNDVFWYIEPGVNAEINITKYFRINVGISKRFTQDLNLYNTPSDAFDKLNYTLVLKFGGF
jgi:hypothetical protein